MLTRRRRNFFGGGGSPSIPAIEDEGVLTGGRLTLQQGVPIPTGSLVSQSTIYYTGGRTHFWTGSALVVVQVPPLSLALSGLTTGAIYEIVLDYNGGTPQLTTQIWAGAGTVITGATNATPIVLTATGHPYQNGDELYVDGVRDSTNEVIPYAVDGAWIAANRAANTVELAGSSGVADYFRGGVISGRLAAGLLDVQNELLVMASDLTRRPIGIFRATSATTTEDSATKRFLYNHFNQVERFFRKVDMDDHTIQNVAASGASGYRVYQEAGANSTRVEWVQGLSGMPVKLSMRAGVSGPAGGHVPIQVGINATPRVDYSTCSQVFVTNGNGNFQTGTLEFCRAMQNGYHYADIMEAEVGNQLCTLLQACVTGSVWA